MDRKKVLLVDDVDLFLELEKTFFRRENIEIIIARDGQEALDIIGEQRPDLVFLDLYMPKINGNEVCRRVKNDPELRSVPIVMVTFGGREEEINLCYQAGCDSILLKPINRHHFLSTARQILNVPHRLSPRVKARIRIYFGPEKNYLLTDYALNLGSGGIFVESAKTFPAGTELKIVFELTDGGEEMGCRARVAWINEADGKPEASLPSGMGIQFIDMPQDKLDLISEYVKKEILAPSW